MPQASRERGLARPLAKQTAIQGIALHDHDIPWILEIEVQAVGGFSRDCAGERRLPDLARLEKRHGWNLFEKLQDASRVSAIDHPC